MAAPGHIACLSKYYPEVLENIHTATMKGTANSGGLGEGVKDPGSHHQVGKFIYNYTSLYCCVFMREVYCGYCLPRFCNYTAVISERSWLPGTN